MTPAPSCKRVSPQLLQLISLCLALSCAVCVHRSTHGVVWRTGAFAAAHAPSRCVPHQCQPPLCCSHLPFAVVRCCEQSASSTTICSCTICARCFHHSTISIGPSRQRVEPCLLQATELQNPDFKAVVAAAEKILRITQASDQKAVSQQMEKLTEIQNRVKGEPALASDRFLSSSDEPVVSFCLTGLDFTLAEPHRRFIRTL